MKAYKTKMVAALAALALTAGCGGGSLPTDQNPGGDDPGAVDPGTDPVNPPASATSLWPLTTGSTWSYAITDWENGGIKYDKTVTVKGPSAVPGTSGVQAIQVESVNFRPTGTRTELSWQVDKDGIVTRLREEDRLGNDLQSVTVWSPATLKTISQLRELGWEYAQPAVMEKTSYTNGTTPTDEPEKPYVWKIVGVNESVTVGAGTFNNALHVRRERTDKTATPRDYWLVPGVGKVKEDGERLEELRSYTVKP